MGRENCARTCLVIWALVLLLIAVSVMPAYPVQAAPRLQDPFPEGERQYFDRTGHWVKGPFLDFFNERGGLRIFGYPQTKVFYDPNIGLWVQYFDNVRMEYHPGQIEPYKVQLGLLGDLLGHREPPLPQDQWPTNSRFRQVFPQTGHTVSFAFLDFYRNNGGLDIFGYPISEPGVEGEQIVQYFQRTRLEWHPERPRDERVVVGDLGTEYIYRFDVPSRYTRREELSDDFTRDLDEEAVTEGPRLRVWAAVRYAITGREGYQTVFVYVTDSLREPVKGAEVTIRVRYPSDTITYSLEPTDDQGITDVTFSIHSPPPGRRVVVEVEVENQGSRATTQTSFLPWW